MKTNIQKQISLFCRKKKNFSCFYVLTAFCLPVLLYLQTINFGFTYFDDDGLILNNIAFLSDLRNIPQVFLTDAYVIKISPFYRPMQTLSYMTDIQLSGGNNPWMYHLSNILLSGFIAGLLFLLFKRILIPPKLALSGVLVYCAHPLFLSCTAWIPARGDLLLTFFSLLSFLFFIDLLQKRKIIYLFLHWIAFTLALFCKETAAFLPFLFILYYFLFSTEKPLRKKFLFVTGLYVISGLSWFWLRSGLTGDISSRNYAFGLVPILSNLPTIPESLSRFFLPFNIAPIPDFSSFRTLTGSLIIVAIAVLLFKNKGDRLKKEKIFSVAWFLILILPTMLFKHQFIDYLDHRFFMPLIGIMLFILFVYSGKWRENGDIKKPWIMFVILPALCLATFVRSRAYSDPMTFYNSAVSRNTNSAFAYSNRGYVKSTKGDFQGAIEDYSKAIALSPGYDQAYCDRGVIKSVTGDKSGAMEDFNAAIAINDKYAEAYYQRGVIKSVTGDKSGAMQDYDKTISVNDKHADAHYHRGIINLGSGNFNAAIVDFSTFISVRPNMAEAYNYRGIAFGSTGNFQEAINNFNQAIEINPEYPEAYGNRYIARYRLRDLAGAIEDCKKVLQLKPDDEKTLNQKAKFEQELKELNN